MKKYLTVELDEASQLATGEWAMNVGRRVANVCTVCHAEINCISVCRCEPLLPLALDSRAPGTVKVREFARIELQALVSENPYDPNVVTAFEYANLLRHGLRLLPDDSSTAEAPGQDGRLAPQK